MLTFFQLNNLEVDGPTFKKTFTFDHYLFNSRSNKHVNLDYLISMHPKKAILPTILGQFFLVKNKKSELATYILY